MSTARRSRGPLTARVLACPAPIHSAQRCPPAPVALLLEPGSTASLGQHRGTLAIATGPVRRRRELVEAVHLLLRIIEQRPVGHSLQHHAPEVVAGDAKGLH